MPRQFLPRLHPLWLLIALILGLAYAQRPHAQTAPRTAVCTVAFGNKVKMEEWMNAQLQANRENFLTESGLICAW